MTAKGDRVVNPDEARSSDEVRPLLMVSNSEIGSFKHCRRKWTLSSFNRQNLIPKTPKLVFWLGTGGHHALERWHGYGEDPIEAFQNWAALQIHATMTELGPSAGLQLHSNLTDMVTLGVAILKHYKAHAEKRILPKYEFIATEYEFSVPIPNQRISLLDNLGTPWPWVIDQWGEQWWDHEDFEKWYAGRGLARFYLSDNSFVDRWNPAMHGPLVSAYIPPLYVGRLDGLVRDKQGSVWVIDHKFMASLVDPELLVLDEQTSKYVWAANVAIERGWWPEVPQGTLVRGALYNVVRKKVPTRPAVLKNRTVSLAKNIDTTEEVYKSVIVEQGLEPMDYVEMLLFLREKGGWDGKQNRFFQLLPVERGTRELELIGERLVYEYEDMNNVSMMTKDIEHPALYPSPSMDCRWKCSFKEICYVANYGGDVPYIIEQTMQKQRRTDLYASQLEEEE